MGKTPKTYFIKTYGCQMNERDSETIAGIFQARGMQLAKLEEADIIMINTCTVRDKAEQKAYGLLGRLRKLKEANPELVLGICGCMPQQQAVAKKIKTRFPFVDIIIGTHNLRELATYLDQVLQERKQVLAIWEKRAEEELEAPAVRQGRFKAFVNINYGCNNFCTYCIVPHVRGREKSRQPQVIQAEIDGLAREGYKEITLLGQNVNSYGKDLPQAPDFAGLLHQIHAVAGIERIRFMTSHPRDVTPRLIDTLARLPKVCNHIHLPLQAGSDHILRRMNRGYNTEHYLGLVEALRQTIPGLALTTDLIVGFPGETEEDFAATLHLVEQVRFDSAFTFIYSPRPGTPAASMENQVPAAVKRERLQQLIELQNGISLACNRSLVGSRQELLVEDKKNEIHKGRTTTHRLVFFSSKEDLSGRLVDVEITEAKTWNLAGRLEGKKWPN